MLIHSIYIIQNKDYFHRRQNIRIHRIIAYVLFLSLKFYFLLINFIVFYQHSLFIIIYSNNSDKNNIKYIIVKDEHRSIKN
jgi:hypothetical protein